MRYYLDADILLALLKQNDHLKQKANRWIADNKDKNELITSSLSCLEVLFYLYKNGLSENALDIIRAISILCKVTYFNFQHIEQSIILSEHHSLSPADSIHAVLAMNYDAIISSDKSFDKVHNLTRIDFTA